MANKNNQAQDRPEHISDRDVEEAKANQERIDEQRKEEGVAPEQVGNYSDAFVTDAARFERESMINREKTGMSPADEAERQQAEQFPRWSSVETFEGQHEEGEPVRFGRSATARSEFGRVIVLDEDAEHDGELYKAGVQDLPVEVADHFISEGIAFEPAGKKKGR